MDIRWMECVLHSYFNLKHFTSIFSPANDVMTYVSTPERPRIRP